MSDQTTSIADLRQVVTNFVAERQWQIYHDPKNLSMAIAIEAAELMEHFQWVRSDEIDAQLRDPKIRSEITDELADITCFVLALTNVLGIELSQKMVKNAAKYPPDTFRGQYFKPRDDRR
jgi:NTP pyrophosphatase (non-canonical NTP hydrolase)